MQEGLKIFYWVVLVFCSISGLVSFRWMDKPGRIIAILINLSLVAELLASYVKYQMLSNLMVYDHFSILEFLLLCIYFNYTIDLLRKRSIGIILGIVGSVVGLISIHFNLFSFYNFLFVETIVMVFLSFMFYFRILLKNSGENLLLNPHFGFISAILFYWLVNFLNWGMYDYLTSNFRNRINLVHNTLLITNMITYLMFTTVFLFFSRKHIQSRNQSRL